ncbi:MAG: hypothetical protein H0W50_08035 [Parachlamydiaceae bacterium]|nr:hypothetical protein [Parachlamydiaceae bacterium]
MNTDLFYQFTDFYENGQFLQAFQSLLNHPDIIFDTLLSDVPSFQHLINYADACVFMGDLDSQFAREALIAVLEADERLKIISQEFISILKIEQILQTTSLSQMNLKLMTLKMFKNSINQSLNINFTSSRTAKG